jgi:hypothetical protein
VRSPGLRAGARPHTSTDAPSRATATAPASARDDAPLAAPPPGRAPAKAAAPRAAADDAPATGTEASAANARRAPQAEPAFASNETEPATDDEASATAHEATAERPPVDHTAAAHDVAPAASRHATHGLDAHADLRADAPRGVEAGPSRGDAPATADAAPQPDRQEVANQVANRMTLRRSAHADVDVPNLGRIHVDAHSRAGEVDVAVLAQRIESAGLLAATRGELADHLRDAHVPLGRLDVGLANDGGRHEAPSDRRDGRRAEPGDPASEPQNPAPSPVQGRRVRIVL